MSQQEMFEEYPILTKKPETLAEALNQSHCPKCLGLVSTGAGHGKLFVSQWRYCDECDLWIEFQATKGLPLDQYDNFKRWIRDVIIAAERKKVGKPPLPLAAKPEEAK